MSNLINTSMAFLCMSILAALGGVSCASGTFCNYSFTETKNPLSKAEISNKTGGLEIHLKNLLPTYKTQSEAGGPVNEQRARLNAKICASKRIERTDTNRAITSESEPSMFSCIDLPGTVAPGEEQWFYVSTNELQWLFMKGDELRIELTDDISRLACSGLCRTKLEFIQPSTSTKQILEIEVIQIDTVSYTCNTIIN